MLILVMNHVFDVPPFSTMAMLVAIIPMIAEMMQLIVVMVTMAMMMMMMMMMMIVLSCCWHNTHSDVPRASEARKLTCRSLGHEWVRGFRGEAAPPATETKQKTPGPRPQQDEGSSALECSRTIGPSTLNGLGLRV